MLNLGKLKVIETKLTQEIKKFTEILQIPT